MVVSKEQFLDAINKLNQAEASQPELRVALLTQIILYADQQYYLNDDPVLADKEYDDYYAELKKLEEQYPHLRHPNLPTQRVASGRSERFEPVSHIVPMLSLENSYNAEDLIAWDKRLRETLKTDVIEYSVEPKYDGAGISLIYEQGKLQVAATRGDGLVGEDITINAKQIRSIPLYADFPSEGISQIEIRGEVLIKKQTFKEYNEQRIEEGLPPLANPRNAASGTLRILDPEEVRKRGLHAILYHISYVAESEHQAQALQQGHYESLYWLSKHAFATPLKDMKLCKGIQEVIEYCAQYEERRDDLPFEIDGMVVKVNRFDLQEMLGMTSHHPRWAIAFKFKARQASAKLKDVEFQVGRTGIITPVAKIEPVYIGGVTISSISLFNEDIIREKDIRIGDTVLVERAGDVIPYIVKSLPQLRTGEERYIEFPKDCPVCHTAIIREEGEVAWRCINTMCPAQSVERMIHFVSKDAMDIRSLGASNVRRFYELGFLKSVEDIYRLPFEQIKTLDKFGERSIQNLKDAIEQSKSRPLHRLIFALGIKFVGEATAKTLARKVKSIFDLSRFTVEELQQLEDIGPKVAASIHHFFQNPDNIQLLKNLEAMGVTTSHPEQEMTQGEQPWNGKTFLFTGTLTHFKRSEAEQMVEARGGKILSGVSSKLNYLIVGADAGSKLDKAKKLNTVQILTEQEFLQMLNSTQ